MEGLCTWNVRQETEGKGDEDGGTSSTVPTHGMFDTSDIDAQALCTDV